MADLIKQIFSQMSMIVLIDAPTKSEAGLLGEALLAKLNAMPLLFGVVLKILTLIFWVVAIGWGGVFTALNQERQRRYCQAWGRSPVGILRSYMGFCVQLLNFIHASNDNY